MAAEASHSAKRAASKGVPESADIEAGLRLRLRRTELKLSQQALGEQVGVTFQQIQKYEKGTNRISTSKLKMFAQILDVEPGYFFSSGSNSSQTIGGFSSGEQALLADQPKGAKPIGADIFQRQETFELIRAYYTITDAKQRRKVLETVRAMASLADNK